MDELLKNDERLRQIHEKLFAEYKKGLFFVHLSATIILEW